MDINHINELLSTSRKALEQIQNQTRIFEGVIDNVLENAPNGDKQEIQGVQILMKKALNLAKQGKGEEAQKIIKDFQDGRKSS